MLTLPCRRDRHDLCSGEIEHRLRATFLDRLLGRVPVHRVLCRCGCHSPRWMTPTA